MDQDELEEREERATKLSEVLWSLYKAACHEQIGPDGKDCAICSSADHQAFQCRFNAFVRFDALRRTAKRLYSAWAW